MSTSPVRHIDKVLRIAQVGPVATSIPPVRSGSIETMTALLTDGLVARGHDVTLFATGASTTTAKLHAVYPRGYAEDTSLWPWELCELFNLAAAVERADSFDVIHCQAEYYPMSLAYTRVSPAPILQTLHHSPSAPEVALWSRYPEAPFVAVSEAQRCMLSGLNVVATVHHAVDTDRFAFRADPDDYLLFLGRFTEGKGVVQAIEAARQSGMRLLLAAAENEYYRDVVAPLVDQRDIVFVGEVDRASAAPLLGGARALLYPVQDGEPFGLVLAEAAACGTPVAALDRGAVREIVEDGVTGGVFESLDALVDGLPRVLALDRRRVRTRAVERFGVDRMVDAYVDVYRQLLGSTGRPRVRASRLRAGLANRQKVPALGCNDSKSGDDMAAPAGPLTGRSLLGIFAHPDDEALACGGLLARCAMLGAQVSLLCATRGEWGPSNTTGAATGHRGGLGEIRGRELEAAARSWASPTS